MVLVLVFVHLDLLSVQFRRLYHLFLALVVVLVLV
jgi:hypothetical protein